MRRMKERRKYVKCVGILRKYLEIEMPLNFCHLLTGKVKGRGVGIDAENREKTRI